MILRRLMWEDINVIPEMWKEDQPFLVINKELFIRKILIEENFSPDGFTVAEENGKIIGFCCAVYRRMPINAGIPMETDRGWISAFCVPDRSLVPTVGKALLEEAERFLTSNGRNSVDTGFFPQYFSQGIEPDACPEYALLFDSLGYRHAESWSLSLSLDSYEEDKRIAEKREALNEAGYTIGALTPEYIPALLDPCAPFSSASWSREFKTRLEPLDYGRIRIAVKDGKLLGAAPFGDPYSDMGRFGPFGVSPSERGKGIGTVLLADCLAEMKKRGIPKAWMQWVSDSGTAYRLYTRAGFTKAHRYYTYSKSI